MKIFIAGLGLIGASYASGLSNKGYQVYGYDKDDETCKIALEKKYVKGIGLNYMTDCEVVILAFYPQVNISFIKENQSLLRPNQVLTDVAGTKTYMMGEIEKIILPDIDYCSHHPMAGKEKKGIAHADPKIFEGANFIVVPSKQTKENSLKVLEELGKALGFKKQTIIDKEKHDKLIGFTSQLPHAMAVALVNADDLVETESFTGDSYRDLTRIAMINEDLWSELFFENRSFLLDEIEKFEKELDVIKNALKQNNVDKLKATFVRSTEKRSRFK